MTAPMSQQRWKKFEREAKRLIRYAHVGPDIRGEAILTATHRKNARWDRYFRRLLAAHRKAGLAE